MVWSWSYDGQARPVTTGSFPSQSEAEAWLAEGWQELYDAGVRSVTLREHDRDVYTMSLESG